VGCVCVAERRVWLGGAPSRLFYVGDLKVSPRCRGRGIGDRLLSAVREWCRTAGPDVPVLATALAGNRVIERRVPGPRGQPALHAIGTVRVHTLLAAGARARGCGAHAVRPARPDDAAAMADLWHRVAPQRYGAAVLDAADWHEWMVGVPGLSWSDYLLARQDGRLLGFLGLWDQRALKETRVLRYGGAIAVARGAYDALARILARPQLPAPGGALHALHVVHLCVPADSPEVLRALIAEARRRCGRTNVPAMEIGLDVCDPLGRALRGLPRIGTDVRCYLTSARGAYTGPPLDGRPIHFETALV